MVKVAASEFGTVLGMPEILNKRFEALKLADKGECRLYWRILDAWHLITKYASDETFLRIMTASYSFKLVFPESQIMATCPFCGHDSFAIEHESAMGNTSLCYFVRCQHCKARGPTALEEEDARGAWGYSTLAAREVFID